MITRAQQQRNATASQFDSSDFFVYRPEEYEGILIVLTTRIIRTGNQLNRLLTPVTWHLEQATMSRGSWEAAVPCKVSNCSRASANRGLPTSPFLEIITIGWVADSSNQSISLSDSSAIPWKWHRSSFKMQSNWCKKPIKDVRANCFCASLLRTQILMLRHATSCIERAR